MDSTIRSGDDVATAPNMPVIGAARSVSRDKILYLSQSDVASSGVTMGEVIEAVGSAFLEHSAGRVEMPPKPGVHPGEGDNFIHAMPALIPRLRSVGVKWVSGYPGNPARGLPYITGLLVLNDPDTGLPIAVMDCVWITAMRTAAASAVAARFLARPDSQRIGILGCGVQGISHVEALQLVLPQLSELRAYDPDPENAERLVQVARSTFGLNALVVPGPRDAVEASDVVVTAGPILRVPHATIKGGWLEDGVFVTAVDFDSYFDATAFRDIDKFATDDIAQFEHFRSLGYFTSVPPVWAEVGDLVAKRVPGRERDSERTMACNLGVAFEDMAVAPLVVERALERGLGKLLDR